MSQSDYIRAKREARAAASDAMAALPSTLTSGTYTGFVSRTISNSVRHTGLRASQIVPADRYLAFAIERPVAGYYATAACPAFALCADTEGRANRAASASAAFALAQYASARYAAPGTAACSHCCYDAGADKTGAHARDCTACAGGRRFAAVCANAETVC